MFIAFHEDVSGTRRKTLSRDSSVPRIDKDTASSFLVMLQSIRSNTHTHRQKHTSPGPDFRSDQTQTTVFRARARASEDYRTHD